MRIAIATVLALLTSAVPAAPQTVVGATAREDLAVTVYRGYVHVRDARRAPAAESLVWTGVAPSIDPGTLILSSGGRPVEVSLARIEPAPSADALLRERAGGAATLVSPTGERIPATIVSADGPVFRVGDRLVLSWEGSFEVPDGPDAAPGPRVEWRLDRPAAGVLTTAYLADGPSWSADYLAVLEGDGMVLRGHATIENPTSFAMPDAAVELVAGEVRRDRGGPGPPRPMMEMAELRVADQASERESFADRILYRLPGRVTIAPSSTTRAPLFDAARLDVERDYVLEGQPWIYQSSYRDRSETRSPAIRLSFVVEGIAEGDAPLPAGTLHLYQRGSDGALRFAGSAPTGDLPSGERAEVVVGAAFDLVAERTQTAFRRIDQRTVETAWRLEVRNRGDERRVVTVLEPLPGEWEILEESRPHERVDATTVRWRLPVPANGSAVLEWRVRSTS